MLSPRHHVVDVRHSESVREAGKRPAAYDQDSVVGDKADPITDGDPPTTSISFIGSLDPPKSETIKSCSMISESHSRRVGFPGVILEKCSWCKKKFPENTDLYMYGYDLGVYCSVECRKKQMASDGYHVEDLAPPRPDRHSR